MGMSATAVKDSAAAAAVAATSSSVTHREKSRSGGSANGGDDIGRSDGSGGSGGGGGGGGSANGHGRRTLDQARPDATGARSANSEHRERDSVRIEAAALPHPPTGGDIEGRDASAMVVANGSTRAGDEDAPPAVGKGENGDGDTTSNAGMLRSSRPGLDDRDGEERPPTRQERQPSFLDSEKELTPERRATRRVGGATRSGRGAMAGEHSNRKKSFRAGAAGQRSAKVTTAANAAKAAKADEARLALAMMEVMNNVQSSGSEGFFSSADTAAITTAAGGNGAGDGQQRQQQQQRAATRKPIRDNDHAKNVADAAAGSSLLGTQIVNTVGGGHGRGGSNSSEAGADFHRPSSSFSSSVDAMVAPVRGAKKGRPTTTAAGRMASGTAGTICGPGLVAVASSSSSGQRRRTDGGGGGSGGAGGVEGDWHLRASRAVGRVREEEAINAAAIATTALQKSETVSHGEGGCSGCGGDDSQNTNAPLLPNNSDSNESNARSSSNSQSRNRTNTHSAGLGIAGKARQRSSSTLDGNEAPAPEQLAARISDSDEDGGDESDWSDGGGGGGGCSGGGGRGNSAGRCETGSTDDREQGPSSGLASAGTTPIAAAQAAQAAQTRPRPVVANKKLVKKKTTEVSDNFVRADLKSRGSSRFKRKGSGRSKARGGSGGRSFGGRGGGRGGRWGRGGRGFGGGRWGGGGLKWGGGNKGGEDPVTGEKGGAPRDRPLSSGAAKNRAGLDVLDQVS